MATIPSAASVQNNSNEDDSLKSRFKIRTVTCFVTLTPSDFEDHGEEDEGVEKKIYVAGLTGRWIEQALVDQGYKVQTVRLATNPFAEWLLLPSSSKTMNSDGNESDETVSTDVVDERLARVETLLKDMDISFCALGPAVSTADVSICPRIVASSPRFSCSTSLSANDTNHAQAAAQCILEISQLGEMYSGPHVKNGLGNFRFCVAAACQDYIPFFPVAKSPTNKGKGNIKYDGIGGNGTEKTIYIKFAVGLENGVVAHELLTKCGSIQNIAAFSDDMARVIQPIQELCLRSAAELAVSTADQHDLEVEFVGIDTSLNPSLDPAGSVAAALEALEEVTQFGAPGTIAAAASITQCLQNLPGIQLVGYCGLMLPLCEDARLVELANSGSLRIPDLLSISHVCGVGLDTVPIPGDCSVTELSSLLLDVAGVAHRWNKSLSCRVFPVPGKKAGDSTSFDDSPHMMNSRILPLC